MNMADIGYIDTDVFDCIIKKTPERSYCIA